jgi:hypothetical protein
MKKLDIKILAEIQNLLYSLKEDDHSYMGLAIIRSFVFDPYFCELI